MISAAEALEKSPIQENTWRFLWVKIENYIADAISKGTHVTIPLTEHEFWSLMGHGDKGCGGEYHYKILIPLCELGYKWEVVPHYIGEIGGYLIIDWSNDD